MTTVGQSLVRLLEAYGVNTVFGIPGVHTIELYRGLARSTIRHVTPRHEQGAGFMADGYARVSGKPGVAFVITGPGLTNTITAMAQARADSVPMLVVSGVNATTTLGKGLGHLHELPDQRAMMEQVALVSRRIEQPGELGEALAEAFSLFASARPGPVHIEIPTDVMAQPGEPGSAQVVRSPPAPDLRAIAEAARRLARAERPLILAGGGARRAETGLLRLAERLGAPMVTAANARGLLHKHPLGVHASPSLKAVRALMSEADIVLAVGTEFGPTDYDMYGDGAFAVPENLVRIDIDPAQLARWPATVAIAADSAAALDALLAEMPGSTATREPAGPPSEPRPPWGGERAAIVRESAWKEIGPDMRAQVSVVETIRDALPRAIVIGDSTQPIYAANLCYDHDRPGGWFNAATGYGALGYGPPAAIGAALADPAASVVCLTGDGGLQFVLAELGSAVDAGAAVIFVVWNNRGYREIEAAMREAGVEPVGVTPSAPDFCKVAGAYGIPSERLTGVDGLGDALLKAGAAKITCLIEIIVG